MTRTSDPTSGGAEGTVKIRWGPIAGCTIIGSLMVVAAFHYDQAGWRDMLPGALLEIGAAFGLAGLLFFLERSFETRVERRASALASEVGRRLDEQDERIQYQEENLTARLDDLAERAAARVRREDQEADARIASVVEDVSFESLTAALEEAFEISALAGGEAVVPASPSSGFTLTFRWGWHRLEGELSAYGDRLYQLQLTVTASALAGHWEVRVPWSRDHDAETTFAELRRALQGSGHWAGEEMIDWAFALRHLVESIQVAVEGRRVTKDWAFDGGSLLWLSGPDLAVLDNGLCRRRSGVVITSGAASTRNFATATWPPPPPDGLEDDEWSEIVTLAENQYAAIDPSRAGFMDARPIFGGSIMSSYYPKARSGQPPPEIEPYVVDR